MKKDTRFKRIYSINENAFDNIDSEYSAYFLGLLFADGSNTTKTGVISIDLVEEDEHILKELANFVESDRPLRTYKNYNRPNAKDKTRFVINSKHMSSVLDSFGMIPNKSLKIKFPVFLDEDLIHHFVRGYFDGNGSIGIFGKVKNVAFSVCSTESFLLTLQEILMINCNLNKVKLGKRHKDRDSDSYHLRYTGRFSCQRIREWLYKDATIYLERKYDKFNSF